MVWKVKIKIKWDEPNWEVSTDDPKIKETNSDLKSALDELERHFKSKLLKTINPLSVMEISRENVKASGVLYLGDHELDFSNEAIIMPMEDDDGEPIIKLSSNFSISFQKNYTLDKFLSKSPEEQEKIVELTNQVLERSAITGEDPMGIIAKGKAELEAQKAGAE